MSDKDKQLVKADDNASRRLSTIIDRKVSLQSIVEGSGKLAASPFRAVARYWAMAHGRLPDAPNHKAAVAHLPKGSIALLRNDGSIIHGRVSPRNTGGNFTQMFDRKAREKAKDDHSKFITELLAEARAQGHKLNDISLVDQKLDLITLSRMQDLTGADFRRAKLTRMDFVRTNLEGARFWRARFGKVCFEGANLQNTDFTAATVIGDDGFIDFALADLRGASFSHDFPFEKTRLTGANLEGVKIINARGDVIEGATLGHDGQVMYGAGDLAALPAPNAPRAEAAADGEAPVLAFGDLKRNNINDWTDARLAGMEVSRQSQIPHYKGLKLRGKSLEKAHFTSIDIIDSDLSETDMVGTTLTAALFMNCDLRKADFTGATMALGWRLSRNRGSSDCKSCFTKCDLTGARLPLVAIGNTLEIEDCVVDGVVLVNDEGQPVPNATLNANGTIIWANGSRPDVVFAGEKFDSRNFEGTDLSDLSFEKTSLVVCKMAGIKAPNRQFTEAYLSSTDFTKAELQGSNFAGAVIADSDFTAANLEGAQFDRAEIKRSIFRKANLKRADFSRVVDFWFNADKGQFVDMREANLTGARFAMDSDFRALKLDGAKLDGVQIVDKAGRVIPGAKLVAGKGLVFDATAEIGDTPIALDGFNEEFVTLEGAPLKGADLSGLKKRPLKLAGADLRGAILPAGPLEHCDFTGAILDGQSFPDKIKHASFKGASLRNVTFNGSEEIHLVDFEGADLRDADFSSLRDFCWNRKSDQPKINFRNADLTGTRFRMDCDFDACDLRGAKVDGAIITDRSGRVIPGAKLTEKGIIEYARNVDLGGIPLDVRGYDLQWGPSLEGAPLRGADLSGFPADNLKLAGADLRDAKLPDGNITNGDFRKAVLDGWQFSAGKVQDCSFRDASLKGARFTGKAQIHTCDFRNADLTDADFSQMEDFWYNTGENPKFCRMEGAKLTGARFRMDTDFAAIKFAGADLKGVIITDMAGRDIPGATLGEDGVVKYDPKADLGGQPISLKGLRAQYAPLNGAPLQGADLTGFDLAKLQLRGANLTGALLPAQTHGNIDYSQAVMPGARYGDIEIERNSYRRAIMDGAVFNGTKIDRCDFRDASLKGADFSTCDDFFCTGEEGSLLQGADLTGSKWRVDLDLNAVNLAGAKMDNIELRDMQGTVIPGAKLTTRGIWSFEGKPAAPAKPANFSGARLEYVKLPGANMPGAIFDTGNAKGLVLSNATLSGADFGRLRMNGANLREARLAKADFSRIIIDREAAELNLEGADLTGSIWRADMDYSRINLHGAKLDGVTIVDQDGAPINGARLTANGIDLPGKPAIGGVLHRDEANDRPFSGDI